MFDVPERRQYDIVKDIEIILAKHQLRLDTMEQILAKQTEAYDKLNTRVAVIGTALVFVTGISNLAPYFKGG